jgi:transposase InsO family protein
VLADEGVYIASESSFHRVLRAHGQMNRRGRARPPRRLRPPTTHIATGPGDVWCWDVTLLPATVQGRWFYLYHILDLYSRKIVGFEVHDTDSADHAAHLARCTVLAEGVHAMPEKPVLHGDNGATLKGTTVLAMLHWLGIEPSYSRPRVSDDNPYAEALFRTAKYRPEFPVKDFAELDTARQWGAEFVHWYNDIHRHSGIQYVTPAQRHAGDDRPVLTARPNFTSVPARPTHDAGAARPVTGRRSRPSHSIRSGTPWSRQPHLETSFSVRPKRLLSRPGLTTRQPWRATRGKRGTQPPGATRSAHFSASMARTARIRPSPK